MASDLAIQIRDRLNGLVDELTQRENDQEANVLACCIALAVEEVEKWMYKGDFTPSVAPYREGKEWSMPVKPGEEDNRQFTGPSWDRKKKTVADEVAEELPVFKRLKARAANKPVVMRTPSPLDAIEPDRWDGETMRAFRHGDRGIFIAYVSTMVPGVKIALKDASDYASRMAKAYPHLWGADQENDTF